MLSIGEWTFFSIALFFIFMITWTPPTTVDLVVSNGYPLQQYDIETETGYRLRVHRIPYGKNETGNLKRGPLLLLHGLLCSSACWVIPPPNKGLAFRFADAGYDVWLNNDRGNLYSRNHKTLSPSSAEFWDFSFQEMAVEDLSAVVDFVLRETGEEGLTVVGHSMGAMQVLALASSRPQYNGKLRAAAFVGPGAFLLDLKGLGPPIINFIAGISKILEIFGVRYVMERSFVQHVVGQTLCHENSIMLPMCNFIFFMLSGFDEEQVDKELVKTISDHCPTGTPVKQIVHLSQLIKNGGKFTKFDYGEERNLVKYSSSSPPEYDLRLVTVPINIHYSIGDYMSTETMVKKLVDELPNAKAYKVPLDQFNHVDYMWASDVNRLLNDQLISLINKDRNTTHETV